MAGRAAPSRPDRPHGGDRRLHRIGRYGRGVALGDRDRAAGVAALPPPARVRGLLPGGPAGGPAGDGGPPTALRGGAARQLGRLGDAVPAGRHPGRDPGRGALHPGPGGPLAPARQVGRDRPGRSVRAGQGLPGCGRPHRRAPGRRDRGRGLGCRLPAVRAQRDLPGHLQAGPQRPPGRRWAPRRGDPPGPGRPARADRARGRAVRAVRARPGRPHCGSRSRARPAPPAMSSASCTPRAISAPTAPTSSGGRCCTGGWRTRSRSTPSSGWSSRRTTRWP